MLKHHFLDVLLGIDAGCPGTGGIAYQQSFGVPVGLSQIRLFLIMEYFINYCLEFCCVIKGKPAHVNIGQNIGSIQPGIAMIAATVTRIISRNVIRSFRIAYQADKFRRIFPGVVSCLNVGFDRGKRSSAVHPVSSYFKAFLVFPVGEVSQDIFYRGAVGMNEKITRFLKIIFTRNGGIVI